MSILLINNVWDLFHITIIGCVINGVLLLRQTIVLKNIVFVCIGKNQKNKKKTVDFKFNFLNVALFLSVALMLELRFSFKCVF